MNGFNLAQELESQPPLESILGKRLRKLRKDKGFSLRSLASHSGLNVNTLSSIENGKSSPSVGTLQQLAMSLNVPISVFFEVEHENQRIVFTPADYRPQTIIGDVCMQDLGQYLTGNAVQPFMVVLNPGFSSGNQMIVHAGYEFVYCLSGSIKYTIDKQEFHMNPNDSMVFEAHLPHCWKNDGQEPSQILLIFYPSDEKDEVGGRHFSQRE